MQHWIKKEKVPLMITAVAILALASLVAMVLKPRYDQSLADGRTAFTKSDWVEAESQFTKAVQVIPFSGEARANLGATYKRLGQDDLAISELTLAIILRFDSKEVRTNRAAAYYLKGNLTRAQRDLEEALKKDPSYPLANYWLAMVLWADGRPAEARAYAGKAAAADQRLSGILDQIK